MRRDRSNIFCASRQRPLAGTASRRSRRTAASRFSLESRRRIGRHRAGAAAGARRAAGRRATRRDGLRRAQPELDGGLHHPARAKRVVQLFMSGAASQCDTFDYKPELIRRNGQPFDPGEKVELFQSDPGQCMPSPWAWQQYGQCGKWMSDLVPHLAECVDDIAFIHSMVSKSNVHGPATFMQNTGFVLPGFPSMGAWLSYGLGSMNQRPADVRGAARLARLRPQRAGQLDGRVLAGRASGDDDPAGAANPIADLVSAGHRPGSFAPKAKPPGSRVLAQLESGRTRPARQGDTQLEARIRSYELAARLQPAPRSARPGQRERADARTVWLERAGDRGFRPQLPGRPAAAGAGRAIRAGVERRRQRLSAAQLGLARRHRPRSRHDGGQHGSAGRGA